MGFRALIEAALKQREKGGMSIALATQIISAYQNTGPAVKKRDDLYKMAEANKAFAHFRWN
jgi:small subunit ribosomal protein S7